MKVQMGDQLTQSMKKWNEEGDLGRWESHYSEDNYNGNRLRSREKKVIEYLDGLNLPKNSKILELGYGAGMTSAKIYGRGYNLIGIDFSNKLRELAIKNCEKVKNDAGFDFQIGNAENLDFQDNSFDCVVGLGFLQYLNDPMSCLRESHRVLKAGGYFMITQRNMYGISSVDGPLKWVRSLYYLLSNRRYELRWQDTPLIYPMLGLSKLMPLARARKFHESLRQHQRVGLVRKNAISFNRLKRMIKKAGFSVERYDGAGYLSKKSVLFPKTARRLDKFLQESNNKKSINGIHKFGNSVVFLARKN